jgi:hypothetical protein
MPKLRKVYWFAVYKKIGPAEHVPVALFADEEAAKAYHANPGLYSEPIRRAIEFGKAPLEVTPVNESKLTQLLRDIVTPGESLEVDRAMFKAIDEAKQLLGIP